MRAASRSSTTTRTTRPSCVATLEAARQAFPGRRLVAVFQPHLFSRTLAHGVAMGRALAAADVAVVTEIYAAREQPIPGVSGAAVVEAARVGRRGCAVCPVRSEVAAVVRGILRPGDVLLTLGAGDITRLGPELGHLAPGRMTPTRRQGMLVAGALLLGAAAWFGGPRRPPEDEFLPGTPGGSRRERRAAGRRRRRGAQAAEARQRVRRSRCPTPAGRRRSRGCGRATVHRRLPGTLVVEIVEARAVALAPNQGRLAMVGRNGKFLPFDPTVSAPDLPVISAPDAVVARLLGRVQEMDPELFSRVVTASQVRGDVVLDLGGRRLWLRPDVTTEVIRAVTAAEQDLGRRGRVWAELDGRFAGQVVVRWRAG